MTSTDYYSLLGVARTASDADLKAAYRRRVRETHPDMGGNATQFRQVQEAWEILGDPKARASYDLRTSTTYAEPEVDPAGATFGNSFFNDTFSASFFAGQAQQMAEQVRRMQAEREAREARIRGMADEAAALRRPLWPLNYKAAGVFFGSLYVSHRYAGTEYHEVNRWRRRDAWFVRATAALWLVANVVFYVVYAQNPGGLEGVMTALFLTLVSTFVGVLVLAGGLVGAHIRRWLGYTIPKRSG